MASFDSLGPLSNAGRSIYRAAKNYTKGYSDIQTKVRAATSNDPFGPSGTQMNELAQATFNQQDFIEIMEMLDKRLNDKGKNWRHVFKALTVLDYLLHAGSENCVLYFQENMYIIKTLREFVHIDDDGKDQGANVRQKAKEITALLMDDARIKEQRRARSDMRDRMSGYPTRPSRPDDDDSDDDENEARRNRRTKKEEVSKEDADLQRALEESKRMAAAEQARSKRNQQAEDDLEKAIRLSKEEEERRRRALEGNQGSLFDPDNPNGNRNGSAWDSLIDMSDQQPQQQPQQQMPMITGFPTTQFQSFNPYYQQQQEELMRQQQMMEMQRQMQEQEAYNQMMQQQAMLQQQQQQQQMLYQQQLAQQQQMQQQPLIPQHTAIGSNNPFAAFAKPASPPPMPTQQPPPLVARPASTPAQPQQQQRPPRDDGKYAHLAGLLGNRDDGVDTFGNQGALRYGQAAGRVMAQQTGSTNPFNRQQQQQQQQQQQPYQQQQQRNDLLLDL